MISFGGFLNSNFWQNYRQQSSPSIEDLLNKSDCSVEKLLDDDDVLQEFKNQNQKLLQYFTHEQLKKLIDFITVMPPEDATHARGHKYPFLSAEIFNCELNTVLEKFFEAPEPPQPAKNDEAGDKSDEEDEKDEEEKDDKENEKKVSDREAPAALGMNDFRPPYEGDDDPENDIQNKEREEAEQDKKEKKKEAAKKAENAEEKAEEKKEGEEPAAEGSPEETKEEEKKEEPEPVKEESKTEENKEKEPTPNEESKPPTGTKPAQGEDKSEQPAESSPEKPQEPQPGAEPDKPAAEEPKAEKAEPEAAEEVKAESEKVAEPEKTKAEPAKTEEAKEEAENKNTSEPEKPVEESKEEAKAEGENPESAAKPTAGEAGKEEAEEERETSSFAENETTAASVLTAAEEQEEQEPVSKYMLLERLFKFIRAEEAPLNPVLAGYFCKLLILLINRKQKQIIPYIFGPDSDILDCLLKHLYQKSVAEVLNKLMNIVDTNFDGELATQIQEKKQKVLSELIDKLQSDRTDEENMNAAAIIIELMELKQFYTMLSKRATLQKFSTIAFAEHGTVDSRQECLTLLNKFVQQFKEKQVSGNDDSSLNAGEEDDEIIINEASDEENNAAKDKADAVIVEILAGMMEPMKKTLLNNQPEVVISSLNLKEIKPLGILRLRTIELLAQLVKLNKAVLTDAVQEHNLLSVLMQLVEAHPWNNFLQLKTQQIFEDLMESETLQADTRLTLIKNSGAVPACIKMGDNTTVKFSSQNQMRHGYMGFAIKLSNLIKKKMEADSMATMEGGEEVFNADWTSYMEGELTRSNTENARNLGGRPHSNDTEEEETNQFDVNMDRIMQRFNCFNSIMQNSTTEDEKNDEIADEPDEEDKSAPSAHVEVTLPETVPLDSNYSDAGYWKVQGCEENLDDLLADYE